jgi:hypothetical protein
LPAGAGHYGLIPEYVPTVTSVTAGRWQTPLESFEFRYVKRELLWGSQRVEVAPGQKALLTTPEKALLDLIHLQPGGDSPDYLRELRLQNLEHLDPQKLQDMATRAGKAKLQLAASFILAFGTKKAQEDETL